MSPDEPPAEAGPRGPATSPIVGHFWRSAALTFGLAAAFSLSAWLTVRMLPAGEAFVLLPQGWTAVTRFAQRTGLVFIAAFIVTVPAFVVRRCIGCVLRALMFLIFVVALSLFTGERHIAVVRTQGSFLFVRRLPFGRRAVPNGRLPEPQLDETARVRILRLRMGGGDDISCESVHKADRATSEVLDRLIAALREARASARGGTAR